MPRSLSPEELDAIESAVVAKIPNGYSDVEFDRVFKPLMAQAVGIAENSSGPLQGSGIERALGGLWKTANPIAIAQGLYGAVRHPIDTAGAIYEGQADQFRKAVDAPTLPEKIGYATASVLPVVGPMAAKAGERIGSGDVAGGLGEAAGVLLPGVAGGAALGRAKSLQRSGRAATLEREAARQVSERVLAPGNVAFRGRAEAIAPEILKRKMTGGRVELSEAADAGMQAAGGQIDAAIDAAGGPQSYVNVNPITARLRRKIDDLSVGGQPIKGAEARVAGLQARINQLEQTAKQQPGPVQPPLAPIRVQTFEDLRKIRDEQYRLADEAKAYRKMGQPHLSDEGFAAAETGSEIRREFATLAPDLASANADFAFFKTLGDVLDPAQGRPKQSAPPMGVTGGAATVGTTIGAVIGSPKVAFALGVVRPWIQKMRSEPAWQLADAQSKMRLAEAIRAGDIPAAQRIMARIEEFGPRATNPNESQSRAIEPAWSTP